MFFSLSVGTDLPRYSMSVLLSCRMRVIFCCPFDFLFVVPAPPPTAHSPSSAHRHPAFHSCPSVHGCLSVHTFAGLRVRVSYAPFPVTWEALEWGLPTAAVAW